MLWKCLVICCCFVVAYGSAGYVDKNKDQWEKVCQKSKLRWNESASATSFVLDEILEEFASFLIPPEDGRAFGLKKVHEISELLRRNRADFDRTVLGGSMGKNTAVYFPGISPPLEFDIFVYLNNDIRQGESPSWTRKVKELEEIIVNSAWGKSQNVKIIKVNSVYLSIFVEGIKIDISPVANLKRNSFQKLIMKNNNKIAGSGHFQKLNSIKAGKFNPYEKTQLAETLEHITKLPNPIQHRRSPFRGSFDAQVMFFNNKIPQLSLKRSLIRLAKFWAKEKVLKRLNWDSDITVVGLSSLVEQVVLHAFPVSNDSSSQNTIMNMNLNRNSLSEGFIQLLKLLINFHSLNITTQHLDEDLNNFIKTFKQQKMDITLFNHSQICHVPGPFVADPVDPIANYATLERNLRKREKVIEIIIAEAKMSLAVLSKLKAKLGHGQSKKASCKDLEKEVYNFFLQDLNCGK